MDVIQKNMGYSQPSFICTGSAYLASKEQQECDGLVICIRSCQLKFIIGNKYSVSQPSTTALFVHNFITAPPFPNFPSSVTKEQ